jgi:ACS family glucarate transporter-like MFS transporter
MTLFSYLDRVNLSVTGPLVMKDLGFDKVQLGMTMSAFFLGYVLMQIPGGLLSEKFGIRKVGSTAIVWWSVFTSLTAVTKTLNTFIVVRFLFGVGEGPLFPNIGSFFAKWFGKDEKATIAGIMNTGAFLGPALGPPIIIWIMTQWGWHSVFYIFAVGGIITGVLWYTFSRDYPHLHPRVNQAEVMRITGTTVEAAKAAATNELAPWRKFLVSPQFWAFGVQYFTVNYVMYVFLSWLPIYLLEARGLKLSAMGTAAAYPWLALSFMVFASGKASDMLLKRGYAKFWARSAFAIVGLLLCGLGLYMGANARSQTDNIMWLTFSLGSLGLCYVATWSAAQDLGKKFASSVVGWQQVWSNLAGLLAPTITALAVRKFGWQTTFSMTSLLIIIGVVLWLIVRPDRPLVQDAQ